MSNSENIYVRKEWMHPEDIDLSNPANHVLYLKHLKAYEHALQFVGDKTVLEIGCGSGYGNRLLTEKANKIFSVDIDTESLEFAKKHNYSKNVKYIEADVTKGVSLDKNSCDMCVCFQVIEHIDQNLIPNFLSEIKRIVKPKGLILFTTPNRKIRLYTFQKPINKYHKTEFSGEGLRKLLTKYFEDVTVHGMQAIPKLKQIEINRSKPSLFKHYILFPAKKILGVKGPLLKQKTLRTSEQKQQDKSDFVTSNFWLDAKVPNDSIDLLAHCTNP